VLLHIVVCCPLVVAAETFPCLFSEKLLFEFTVAMLSLDDFQPHAVSVEHNHDTILIDELALRVAG
jgi:hypothetical protein